MSLPTIGSALAERVGQGEVGGCTRRVLTALPHLGSTVERPWLVLFGIKEPRNKQPHLVWPPFPTLKAHTRLVFTGSLDQKFIKWLK